MTQVHLTTKEALEALNISSFYGYEDGENELDNLFIKKMITQICQQIDFSLPQYQQENCISAFPITVCCFDVYLFEYKFAFMSTDQSFNFELKLSDPEKTKKILAQLIEKESLQNLISKDNKKTIAIKL